MQFKTFFGAAVLALALTSCSSVQKVVYRIDVPQGNYLEAATVAQVKPGMTAPQVQYLLGTPVLIDPYSNLTWYYVFLEQQSYQKPVQHTFVVNYNPQGVVTAVDLDKPLPEVAHQDANNTIISTPEIASNKSKRWWQFWK